MLRFLSRIMEDLRAARLHGKLFKNLMIDHYIRSHKLAQGDEDDPENNLNTYEFGTYSQYGEDEIIEEIFNRIGTTNNFFVKLGVGDGNECNSALLLVKGWSSLWIEGNTSDYAKIRKNFHFLIRDQKLAVSNDFITADNIENLLVNNSVPWEFDLLSIDIDGNDYWVWKAIDRFHPRVVVVEYSASFKPPVKWVVKYNPTHKWDKTNYFGVSLKSY